MALKIFKKTNYIYIVDTETDQLYEGLAKDVRFNRRYVDDTLFYINGMGDFPNTTELNFADIVDENGDAYTDLATFVAWYEEETGFSVGGSTPETTYIPLAGTTEGNPVTGNIEIEDLKGISCENVNEGKSSFIGFEDGISVLKTTDTINDTYSYIQSTGNGVELSTNDPLSGGLYGALDFSGKFPENKLIYAQRSYVEKPETLINALNNCDETQLTTIKGILGIT